MNKISILSSSLLLSSIALGISATIGLGAGNSRSPKVDTIKQKIESGCGCGFSLSDKYRRSQGLIFSSGEGDTAIMNIDGRDVRLQKNSKLESYSNDSISVVLDLKLTKKDYEANDYIGKIKVKRSGKITTLKVIGTCGC